MPVDIEICAAAPRDELLIAGLMQFYLYDFSEIGSPDSLLFRTDPVTGAFPPYPGLGKYWTDPGHLPFVIRAGGEVAGFALVNTTSHEGRAIDWNMGEFFVLRKFRRAGVGAAAVRHIVRMQAGRWEIAAMERNRSAREFWPRAIMGAPNVVGFEARAGDGVHWNGPIWSFHTFR